MTERGPFTDMRGAPDPAEPSNTGDTGTPASRPRATASPADLGEVRRTDAIIESLAGRRAAGSASRPVPGAETGRPRPAEEPDPAVRLLRALINDVDDPDPERGTGAEPAPPPSPGPGPGPGSGPRRRGPRTIVALGVAGAVLASTGVAAAGSGVTEHSSSAAPAPRSTAGTSEDAEKTVRADTDAGTYAGTYERPRPPVRPAPEPVRPAPAPAPTPSDDPGDRRERDKPRTRYPFPFGPRPHHPDAPTVTVQSPPASETEDRPTDDPRSELDDLHKRVKKYMDEHDRPHRHDD